jgi:hypothetical protein
MKYIPIFILLSLLLSSVVKCEENSTNIPVDLGLAAGLSIGLYTVCHTTFGTKDKYGCIIGSLIVTNILMVCNMNSHDTTRVLDTKLWTQVVGSTIVIPIAFLP